MTENEGQQIRIKFLDAGESNPDDDDPDRCRSANETYYDEQIAPALLEIANNCKKRGMSFVAQIEYAPGETGSTRSLTEDAGFKMRLLHAASRANGNVDSLIKWIYDYGKKSNQIDVSIYLRMLDRQFEEYDR